MGKLRGFEVVSEFKDNEYVQMPKRGTEDSAGYDFVTIEDVVIPSVMENALMLSQELESFINRVYSEGVPKDTTEDDVIGEFVESIEKEQVKATLVKTGIKAYMQKGEVLKLYIRSSMAVKKGLALANSTAIIDADYFYADNEGHIMLPLINLSALPVFIPAGTRIAQGVFETYLVADQDDAQGVRTGGFGSTGESSVS